MKITDLRIGDIVCKKRTKYLSLVGACGTTIRTIKQADETISDAIEKGIVGVGFKDKRMC